MNKLKLPCGGTAYFDYASGISYRCSTCFAIVGSIGQSQSCKDAAKMYENWEALGGEGWDYRLGKPKKPLHGTEYDFNPNDYPI